MLSKFSSLRSALLLLALPAWIAAAAGPLFAQGSLADLFTPAAEAAQEQALDLDLDVRLTASDLRPGGEAVLSVAVTLPRGFHIYSTRPDFSGATKITVDETVGLTPLQEEFRPDRAPKAVFEQYFGPNGQDVEKFYDRVTWTRKYRIDPDARLDGVSLVGRLEGQYCSEGQNALCIPIRPAREFEVALTQAVSEVALAAAEEAGEVHPFVLDVQPTRRSGGRETEDPLRLRFELSPQDAKPGERVTLSVTATLQDKWYTFALTQNPKNVGLPTVIRIENIHGLQGLEAGFAPTAPHEVKQTDDGREQRVHKGKVTWTRQFEVLPSAEPGGYGLSGNIRYQVCSTVCWPPKPVPFAVGDLTRPVKFEETAVASGADVLEFRLPSEATAGGLPLYLLLGFLGGLILNVMPCVLPVVAIKAMSFVQQAGESRGRILALNIAYSLGVISVFLILATLVAGVFTEKFGWGELFQGTTFNLIMACVIFAMGLSLLGVFEIPVPGMIGSAAGKHQQEGLTGAFLTGIFATVLATPCSGPFLGATLAWSAAQPAMTTYLVFTSMGVGLAFPYLVFGLFPQAVRWVPKPGMWMVRFKEICGFALMATVLFFLYILQAQGVNLLAVLIILLGLAVGLWMVGNLYHITTPVWEKMVIRGLALAVAMGIGGLGFSLTRSEALAVAPASLSAGAEAAHTSKLPWQEFTEQRLRDSLADQKTVLLEFTADW